MFFFPWLQITQKKSQVQLPFIMLKIKIKHFMIRMNIVIIRQERDATEEVHGFVVVFMSMYFRALWHVIKTKQ